MSKDWCTAFPDGNWGQTCCKQHDMRYKYQSIPRDLADIELGRCVYLTTKDSYLSSFMYLGVLSFGWIFWYLVTLKKWWRK